MKKLRVKLWSVLNLWKRQILKGKWRRCIWVKWKYERKEWDRMRWRMSKYVAEKDVNMLKCMELCREKILHDTVLDLENRMLDTDGLLSLHNIHKKFKDLDKQWCQITWWQTLITDCKDNHYTVHLKTWKFHTDLILSCIDHFSYHKKTTNQSFVEQRKNIKEKKVQDFHLVLMLSSKRFGHDQSE